jgi:hypothetical protein
LQSSYATSPELYGRALVAFFALFYVVRLASDEVTDPMKLKGQTKEWLQETFPEWWTFSGYLSQDIWISVLGLAVTFVGLLFELYVLLVV